MNLADRLAAPRESRSDGDLQEALPEGFEGLPEIDHAMPEPVSPVASAVAAAEAAARGGKRRADVPAAMGPNSGGGSTQPGSVPRTPAPGPALGDAQVRRGFVNTAQSDRIEELKSSVHVQL